MDKRALMAIGISLLILVIWTTLFPQKPPAPPPETASPVSTAAATGAQNSAPSEAVESAAAPEPAPDAPLPVKRQAAEGAPPVVIETDLVRIEVTNPGAKVVSWTLKKYQDDQGNPYELISPASKAAGIFPLHLWMEDMPLRGLLNERALFDVERAAASASPTRVPATISKTAASSGSPAGTPAGLPGSSEAPALPPGETFRFVWSDGRGLEAEKTLTVREGSYLAEVSASVRRNGKTVPGYALWGPGIGTPTPDELASAHYRGGNAIVDLGNGPSRFSADRISAPIRLQEGVRWIGLEEHYFAAVLLPEDGLPESQIVPILVDTSIQKTGASPPAPTTKQKPATTGPSAQLSVAVPLGQTYQVFAGPKDYQILNGLGQGLPDLVTFESSIPVIGPVIGILGRVLYAALLWLHSFIPNYGVAIIILTTVIKIAFYPLTQRAMVKMRAVQGQMQKVKPKVDAIKNKYKKVKDAASRTKMNQEVMDLYKREGINPMASLGGCLPLLLQLPILYGFYSVLTVSFELRQAPFFGWIKDLSQRDPYYITPILMGVSMFAQQKMAMTTVVDPQQKMQQKMMLMMPFIFTYTFLALPSGLVLYWLVNNVLGIAQQALINKQTAALDARSAPAAGKI